MADLIAPEYVGTAPAIGLSWEGRGDATRVVQRADSTWVREEPNHLLEYCGLTGFRWHGRADDPLAAVAIAGDRLDALDYLARVAPGYFSLVHIELPRTVLDDKELQFHAEDLIPDRVWLEVAETFISAGRRLARPDGVVSVLCGDDDSGLARVLCDELLGRPGRIGDVVWQKAYAPHDQKPTKKLAGVHDTVLLYAVSPTLLRPVGLRGAGGAAIDEDGDPRGPWIAEHKGAPSRRNSTDFDAFRPPYRWEKVRGELPPGVWRISPMTGAIWGEALESAGVYTFTVQVADATGDVKTKRLTIEVVDDGPAPAKQTPPGIFEPVSQNAGTLRICTASLPAGVVGKPYYATLEATGGQPHTGDPVRPKPPRYWEFSDRSLADALAEDRVEFGAKGSAIARIKRYPDADEDVANQTTWWPGRRTLSGKKPEVFAGYSQDARKHLQALKAAGAIDEIVGSAKPEALMTRLIEIFAPEGSPVLELNAQSGELTAVAMKLGRPAFCLTGRDDRARRYAEKGLLPRLRAVIDGRDQDLSDNRGEPLSTDVYIPYDGGGRLLSCEVGPPLATYDPTEEVFELRVEPGPGLEETVLSALGYLPKGCAVGGFPAGTSLDGTECAICLSPDQFLTPELALELAEQSELAMTIAFFRAEGLERGLLEAAGARFSCIRIPYDLPR